VADKFGLAALIINRTALENSVTTHDLCKARNTKTMRQLRKAVITEIRQRTELSWTEINGLMNRAAGCRRA
jgi:hypothetical protein